MPLQKYTYRGIEYYVDYRTKQFRTTSMHKPIKFINFDDVLGDYMLAKMIKEGVADESKLNL